MKVEILVVISLYYSFLVLLFLINVLKGALEAHFRARSLENALRRWHNNVEHKRQTPFHLKCFRRAPYVHLSRLAHWSVSLWFARLIKKIKKTTYRWRLYNPTNTLKTEEGTKRMSWGKNLTLTLALHGSYLRWPEDQLLLRQLEDWLLLRQKHWSAALLFYSDDFILIEVLLRRQHNVKNYIFFISILNR